MSASLALERLTRIYDDGTGVRDISLMVASGEHIVVIGPSGSGKSTLLRLIAGLAIPDSGRITLDGQNIATLPPHLRHCTLVFQQYALLPHRTVRENIGFGPRMRKLDRQAVDILVDTLIDRVGLSGHEHKRPAQLSGGQQQRVALARALAAEPIVLLLDEPFGALDLSLRRQFQDDLRAIHREEHRTIIHVTHSQTEALALADRIVVLHRGAVAQIGTPPEIYEHPANRFVAEFMEFRNLIPVDRRSDTSGRDIIEFAGRQVIIDSPPRPTGTKQLIAAIRPEHITLTRNDSLHASTSCGIVREVIYNGATYLHRVRLHDDVELEVHSATAQAIGSSVDVHIDPTRIVLLEA